MNVVGKTFIRTYPDHKATSSEVLEWKMSKNVKWACENLWNKVKNVDNPSDTYISHIIQEVLKTNERITNNCLFVISIVELMFDPEIQTTVLSGELIIKRMIDWDKQQKKTLNKNYELDENEIGYKDTDN
ncbi:17079_t:CDS:1 [Funneliformis geosporum]|uniref:4190_t:CDS:1 n=1 Tax=Funneliformis geosporum TaxID=1117311 RepID=A0A9W4SZR4_9GLOM|nr:4190_t:CDS:1 [Funneliformis geosporum]CAI2196240.1 17079_t:CDS:1 [Funneliformis geosporum]